MSEQAVPNRSLMDDVRHVRQEIAAGRKLPDEQVRQHAADCTQLMEQAYARFESTGNANVREEACRWMKHRDQALRSIVFGR